MNDEQFDEWAIVEVMGHERYVGHVVETEVAGTAMLRVDVPAAGDRQAFTKIIGPKSIHSITPVSEATAKAMAAKRTAVLVQRYEVDPVVTRRLAPPDDTFS